jgi:hypothetical protein
MEEPVVRSIIFCTKVFAVSILIFLNFSFVSAQPEGGSIYVLPAGKRIKVRMDTEVNSKANHVNDTFIVRIVEPVINRGAMVIPSGAIIDGRIIRASSAAYGGEDGKLELGFVRLRLNRSDAVELDAAMVKPITAPSRNLFRIAAIGGMTAAGVLFGAASNARNGAAIGAAIGGGSGSVIAFGRKGSNVRVKTNEEFEIELKKEVVLPAKEF